MKCEVARFKLTGVTPMLGSISMNKQIYTDFIQTKAEKQKAPPEGQKNAVEDVENVQELDEKGVTGFYRDNDGDLILKAYQIKGFFKDAARALKDQIKLTSHVSKVDNYVFLVERNIKILRDGKPLKDADDYLERPLRAETAQGPRVALAKSEIVNEGWTIEFTVKVVENKGTAKSVAMTMDVVRSLFEYGELKGLLQWRNAGYGSFEVEEIPLEKK